MHSSVIMMAWQIPLMQMYDSNQLLSSLVQLGSWFLEEAANDQNALALAQAQNGWFTPKRAVGLSISRPFTESEGLKLGRGIQFAQGSIWPQGGLILAGNLPLVGWRHPLLSACRAEVHVKLSSDDAVLPRMVVAKWAEFAPYLLKQSRFTTA